MSEQWFRDRVRVLADAEPPGPLALDDVVAGGRRLRLRRRRLRAGAAGAAVAVATLAVGVQAGVVPAPSRLLSSDVASAAERGRPSALDTGRIRGTLAAQEGWLEDLQRRAAVEPLVWTENPPFPAEDAHVLYASDVERWRVALVEIPGPPQPPEGADPAAAVRMHLWFVGDRGAPVSRLDAAQASFAGDVASLWWGQSLGTTPQDAPTDEGLLVVVSAEPRTVLLAEKPVIAATGEVTFATRQVPADTSGVHEAVVPVSPGRTLWLHHGTGTEWQPLTKASLPADRRLLAGALPPLHDGDDPDLAMLLHPDVLPAMQAASGLDPATSTRRVLWTGTLRGWVTTVVAVTAPSGAHVIFTERTPAESASTPGGGSASPTVLPAGPLEDLAHAWAFGRTDELTPEQARFVGAVAPRGAARAILRTGTEEQEVTVPAAGVVSFAPRLVVGAGATVTFLDRTGGTLQTAQVVPLDEMGRNQMGLRPTEP